MILALGMMIDSSIIVTENITQYRTRGDSLEDVYKRQVFDSEFAILIPGPLLINKGTPLKITS